MLINKIARILIVVSVIAGGALMANAQIKKSEVVVAPLPHSITQDVTTVVRAVDMNAVPGQQVSVTVQADSVGIENTFEFSIAFDPAVLSNPVASLANDSASGTVTADTSVPGKVGIIVSLPAGLTLPAGTRDIASVRFDIESAAAPGATYINFADTPTAREICDTEDLVLNGSYTDGTLNILGPTAAPVSLSGRVLTSTGTGISKAMVTMTSMTGETRYVMTNTFGDYSFGNVEAGKSYVLSVRQSKYSFSRSSFAVNAFADLWDCNFIAR